MYVSYSSNFLAAVERPCLMLDDTCPHDVASRDAKSINP